MKSWFNGHQHTIYSMLDGYAGIRPLLERAKALGMEYASQTDHGNIHGWLDFYNAATDVGVRPALGLEAYQARKTRLDRDEEERAGRSADELEQRGPYHLTLLARNYEGYHNLIKLSSRSYLEGFYGKPRIDHELLEQHSDGLIILSGCLNGEIQQALTRGDYAHAREAAARFQSMVGKEHFFVEVMNHGLPEQEQIMDQVIQIARELDAPLAPTADCHYINKEDAHAHDLMLCVSTQSTISQENRFKFFNDEFYLKPYDEMARIFPEEWLKNTLDIASQIDIKLEFGDLHFPSFPLVPPGETVDSYLERLVREGLVSRYGDPLPQEVRDRANHEFAVVQRMGFQSYFLVVSDLVRWAKEQKIRVGWGRGSAAGSILSYALGITELDPLRFGLLFERFLVEGRKSMPDIDLDFDDRYRDRVIEYARQTYGSDRVAHICTFSTVGAKKAIRDAARVLGYEYSAGDRAAKLVPPPVLGKARTIEQSRENPEFRKAYDADKEMRHIVDSAAHLEGLIRETGIHPAGVVIAPSEIINYVPVMQRTLKNGNPGPIVTQWDMNIIELCGLLKIDFLGIRNLAIIDICINNIYERTGTWIDDKEISISDEATFEQLQKGETIGIFQLESEGMRQMAVAIQPRVFEDIMTIITLYRPGPMGSNVDKMYVSRRHGRERVSYAHPKMEDALKENYGLMLYQEDVLRIAQELAGMTPGEADDLRSAIGKKKLDQIGKYREMFVRGCTKTSKVDVTLANKIYSDIEYFAGYGFNRAHAASYAMMGYVTAYLKTHYPAEYMAALLTTVSDDTEQTGLYLNECRRMGIQVRPPSINESHHGFQVVSDTEILFGLQSVKGIGGAVATRIIDSRSEPYVNIYDFMRRTSPEVLNKGTLEHLVRAGAFDELIPEQPERILSRPDKVAVLDIEKQELGLYVTDHPMREVWHLLEPHVDCTLSGLNQRRDGDLATVAGMVSGLQARTTKRGDLMYRFNLEDVTTTIEVLVFPKEARKYGSVLQNGEVFSVQARIGHEGDEEHFVSKLFLKSAEPITIPNISLGEPIHLFFTGEISYSIIKQLEEVIDEHPGDSPVYLDYQQGAAVVTMALKKPTSLAIKDQLLSIVAVDQGLTNAIYQS